MITYRVRSIRDAIIMEQVPREPFFLGVWGSTAAMLFKTREHHPVS